jgi:putative ABC transport system permease protein
MLRVALAEISRHKARFVGVALAVILGVGFAAASVVFTSSFGAALDRAVAADVAGSDVVVSTDGQDLTDADITRAAAVPGVAAAEPAYSSWTSFRGPATRGTLHVENLPDTVSQRWYTLAAGSWPTAANQIAVGTSTATRQSLAIGDTVQLNSGEDRTLPVTVVALLDTRISPLADSSDNAWGTVPLLKSVHGNLNELHLTAAPGTDDDALAATVAQRLPDTTVQTASAYTAAQVSKVGGGSTVIGVILLAFVVLAGLVAVIVVASTFGILLAQRRRQIGLLRAVGATAGQVRRATLVEAAAVGLVGAVLGLAAGIGVARIACAALDIDAAAFTVDPLLLAVVGVVGVVATVLAAFLPATRAMRIPALAALRPAGPDDSSRRASTARVVIGVLVFLAGLLPLLGAVVLHSFEMALLGGVLTAVGILLLLRIVLPAVLRAMAPLGRLAGVPGRLAMSNAVRNPARAAAACTTLALGIGAIATLLVAANSAQAGADRAVAASHPLDLQVTGPVPTGLLGQIRAIPGMAAAVEVPSAVVQAGPDAQQLTVFGITDDQLRQVRNGGTFTLDQVAADAYTMQGWNSAPGDPVQLRDGGRTVQLPLADHAFTDDGSLVISADNLRRLDPAAAAGAIWGKFADGADPNTVMAAVNRLVATQDQLQVSGAGVERAATGDLLGVLVDVALALLAVTVVIAVVGIGNTVGLSVLERVRESGLLRALGLRRGQLRATVALEAVALALVAAVVGILAGIGFGAAAVGSAFGEAGRGAVLVVPVPELLLVAVGAIVVGLLAAVLPARRAAKVPPVEALADL